MFKVVEEDEGYSRIIPMNMMKPLDIGRLIDDPYEGHIVMRTASDQCPEVMDLTDPHSGSCWSGVLPNTKVKLLPSGTRIILEVV